MTLGPGTRLGNYEIVGPIGAGGMGGAIAPVTRSSSATSRSSAHRSAPRSIAFPRACSGAFGAVLFEMLSGKKAFVGRDGDRRARRHRRARSGLGSASQEALIPPEPEAGGGCPSSVPRKFGSRRGHVGGG